MTKGIDVSRWQGNIDWNKIKAAGIQFAILKAGGSDDGFYTDSKFEQNYKGAKAAGIPVGAYYFVGSKCISKEDGIADAKRFLEIIKGKSFEYPVFIDLESTLPKDKAGATEACIGFCETMEAAKYYCGIYASDVGGFADRLDVSKLTRFDKWVARYGGKPAYVKEYGIWQHTDKGSVPGISGNVDMNEAYKNYPDIITSNSLNGFLAAKPAEPVTDWKAKYEEANKKLEAIKKILE